MNSVNTNFNCLQTVVYQRSNFANWTKSPREYEDCERCGSYNYHAYLYRCYGCDVLHCSGCIAPDPVFIYEFGDFISIFCCVECKNHYVKDKHKEFLDCEECHVIWEASQFKKICEKCENGVCMGCYIKIDQEKMTHTHLDWEDRLMPDLMLD